ncbi:hypothetical protein N8T08_002372 [Aspergillus melleus]|uniref:Uncharacterized protein n=1 Tax=Aspergillus melleus TaxID=138277 RepID=A0ACC3AM48_9EURO|nr:hypothetical protein N8T08_002372 [Aspergillus melleus]
MQSTKAIVANEPTTPGSINWSLQDIQCPISCGPDEVLVEIVATGLCHTDVFVSGVPDGTLGIRYPKIMGHEGAGYIRSIGKASSSDSHSSSSATSNGDSSATSKLQINDPVLLSFPSCATYQHAPRLQLAKDLGATHTLNTRDPGFNLQDAVRAICPEGPSVVIDTTGVPDLIERGLDVAAPRGRIVLVGVPPVGYVVGMQGLGFVESGKSVMGCLVGDSVPEMDIPQLIEWYYEGRFPIDRLITKVPIEDYENALQGTEKGEIIKAVLVWDADQV